MFWFADEIRQHQEVASGIRGAVVGSIGPAASETLRDYGITPDLEPSHPRLGFLVKETAERSAELLQHKK
jgi:uroporphyrinogen-III synthase